MTEIRIMTVAEVIEMLSKAPSDLPVYSWEEAWPVAVSDFNIEPVDGRPAVVLSEAYLPAPETPEETNP